MKRGEFGKRAAAVFLAVLLAAGAVVRPDWSVSARDKNTEYAAAENAGSELLPVSLTETEPEKAPVQPPETEPKETSVQPLETEPEKTPVQLPETEPKETSAQLPETEPEKTPVQPLETEPKETSAQPSETEPEVTPVSPPETESKETSAQPPETEPELRPIQPGETEGETEPDAETEEKIIPETETDTAEPGAESEKTPAADTGQGNDDFGDTEPELSGENPGSFAEDAESGAMYAILYENGDLVFQRGEAPDPSKGAVAANMTGFEDLTEAKRDSWPWDAARHSIRTVSFRDAYQPLTTAYMFYDCRELVSFDSRNFDTSRTEDMTAMFRGCSRLAEADTGEWDTSSVTRMNGMFYGCGKLTELDLRSWDMRQVKEMKLLFYNCQFQSLTLGPLCHLEEGLLEDSVWIRNSTREEYTAEELCRNYKGEEMAGTYIRQPRTEDKKGKILYTRAYEAEKVKVIFDTQGGETMDPLLLEPGTVYGSIVKEIIPIRRDYTFIAWHTGAPDGPLVVSGSRVEQEDVTLFAGWERDPVITFDPNGGSMEASRRQVGYGAKIGDLPRYFPGGETGETLIGWFTEESGGTEVQPDWTVQEDVTYYAHWGWRPVFDENGGVFIEIPDYPYQESKEYPISRLPDVRRDGCTLLGWFQGDVQVREGQILDLSGGSRITARWEQMDTAELTLDPSPWDGSLQVDGIITLKVFLNQPVQKLPNPSRSPNGGRQFLGWFDKTGTQWTEDTVITEDTELHARWTEAAVKVSFDADGGSGLSHNYLEVPAGTTINVLPGARKTNYILEGWYPERGGGGEKLTTETIITKEATYYAHWVSFFINASDETAVYTYGAEWGNASNENVDVIDNTLIVHPTDSQKQTAQLHVRFGMNLSIGEVTLPEKSVQIRIPKYVWKDWDGNDTGTNNLSVNLPEYPSTRADMYFSYIEEEDCYLLVNNQKLSSGAGVDVVISYSVDPQEVPGGAQDADGRYKEGYNFYQGTTEITFCVDTDLDGNMETAESRKLSLEMHTRIKSYPTKEYAAVYYKWQNSWGKKPPNADNYFYAEWNLRARFAYNINQPGTFEWTEEGTVHDGTVVRLSPASGKVSWKDSTQKVILKYPVELLRDASASGLRLHNEVILKTNWKSGYEKLERVQANITIYRAKYPEGEFDKRRSNYSSGDPPRDKLIEGGQEKIAEDETDVSMRWKLAYEGGSRENPVWDEKTGTYKAAGRMIRIQDGLSGDMLYSSGAPDAKYVWEPETGNTVLSDDDYSFTKLSVYVAEYDAECRDGLWTEKTRHSSLDDLKSVDLYVRYKGSDKLSYWTSIPGKNLNGEKTIQLPEGTAGFELRHESSFYYTEISLMLTAKVHPTQAMKERVLSDMEQGVTSLIKNKAYCDVRELEEDWESAYFSVTNYTGGTNPANKEIWELNMSKTTQCTYKGASDTGNVLFDVDRGTQDNPILISGWNYNSSGKAKQLRSGILYDLLPKGTTVDVSTLFGFTVSGNARSDPDLLEGREDRYEEYREKDGKLGSSSYNVRFTDNWKDSGRTMMEITFTLPDDPNVVGADFYYLLHNTYENILLNGTTMENDLAFVNTSDSRVKPAELARGQSVIADARLFDELQKKHEGFISYAEDSVNYIPVDAYSWGFEKSVNASHTGFKPRDEAVPGTAYTYRLAYSQSEYAESSDLVFFDLLEGGYFTEDETGQKKMESQWYGLFAGADVRDASEKLTGGSKTVKCSPVVWYATKDRDSFTGEDYDLSRKEIWSTAPPENLSDVTAVAIDCRKTTQNTDFVLSGQQVLAVYINMRVPEEISEDMVFTYNEGIVRAKQKQDNEPTELTSDTVVEIVSGEPELHKESDPPSGSLEEPAPLKQKDKLEYTLSVMNTGDTRTMTDVTVEDDIPEELEIESSGILVWFSDPKDGMKVSESPRISMTQSGQHLKFVISTLLAGETAHIVIPCMVLAEEGVLENTAHVTSVDGVKKEVKSETTYHEITPYGSLRVSKTVEGNLGDKFYPFSFRLKFTAGEWELPKAWACRKNDVDFLMEPDEDGYLSFTLMDGETVEFSDVPCGTRYEIEEVDGTSAGYKVEAENDSGTVGPEGAQALFVNTKNGAVPTGVQGGMYEGLILTISAAAMLLAAARKRMRR